MVIVHHATVMMADAGLFTAGIVDAVEARR